MNERRARQGILKQYHKNSNAFETHQISELIKQYQQAKDEVKNKEVRDIIMSRLQEEAEIQSRNEMLTLQAREHNRTIGCMNPMWDKLRLADPEDS